MHKLRWLLAIALLLSGCGSLSQVQTRTPITHTVKSVSYDATLDWTDPIHLVFGETIMLSGEKQITFSDVLPDVRYALSEQNCQSAGDVEIHLTVKFAAGQAQTIRLYTRSVFHTMSG